MTQKRGNLAKYNLVALDTPLDSPERQLSDAIAEQCTPPPQIIMDGQVHRFHAGTERNKTQKNGWYIAYADGVPAGSFGDWKLDTKHNWCADVGRELTTAELMAQSRNRADAKRKRDAAAKVKQENAQDTAQTIWDSATPANADHPYLVKKKVAPHCARVTGDGRLVLPLRSSDGDISSLQFISADGTKQFLSGGTVKGCSANLGTGTDTVYICEGFATAASIHEATRQLTIAAYSAANLPAVAKQARENSPTAKLVIVADNDEHQKGKEYADKAATIAQATVVMPPKEGDDANDYRLAGGDLSALLDPPSTDWLIPADEFRSQPAPIRWLVKRWIQRDALIMVHGPSGGGKTFLVLDMVLHMAAGKEDWHGCKVRPGPVAYLAGEGHHGLRGRVAAWCDAYSPERLQMWLSRSGCDLNTTQGYTMAKEALSSLPEPPAVIVVDTLHRFLKGDENSAQDAKTMLDACAALQQEFEAAVILVHHTGVSEEAQHRARGSSAWRGALDIEISIKPGLDDGPIEVCQRKVKDAEQVDNIYFTLDNYAIPGWLDEDGEQVTSVVIQKADAPTFTKDSKLSEMQKKLERAWFHSGAEMSEYDYPYIAKSPLLRWLETKLDYSKGSALNQVKPSHTDKLIGYLLSAEVIEPIANGWQIINEDWASALRTRKNR